MTDEDEKLTSDDVRELVEVSRKYDLGEWRTYATPFRAICSDEEGLTLHQYSRLGARGFAIPEVDETLQRLAEKVPNTPFSEFKILLRQAQKPISPDTVGDKLFEHAIISKELQENVALLTEEQQAQLVESMKSLASALGQNKQTDRLKEILEKGGQVNRSKAS